MLNLKGGSRVSWILALALGLPAVPAVAQGGNTSAEPLGERESYAFARTVEGEVAVTSEGQSRSDEIQRNQPLLSGDRIETRQDSRLEVVLPDRNRLTVDSESAVRLTQLAYSGDRESRVTVLGIDWGEILLEVSEEALGDELPRIESESGTVYVQEPGLYRVRVENDGRLEVVARDGYAELVTDAVRPWSAAASRPRRATAGVEFRSPRQAHTTRSSSGASTSSAAPAGPTAASRQLDSNLDYAADDLDNNGDWVQSTRHLVLAPARLGRLAPLLGRLLGLDAFGLHLDLQ